MPTSIIEELPEVIQAGYPSVKIFTTEVPSAAKIGVDTRMTGTCGVLMMPNS